ncbi:conserved hypothetical protein [Rhodococcus jostii RHA1]|uniref:Uncharacterized protein n=1 Tax=Rhodococcus jostii (strain RHA1) TaxID=101510 RepID=Q0SFX4_RHOJR|nr:conserved hypothetical protein [Rhodococcus jostii RHA1]
MVTAQAVGTLRALSYRDTAITALSARFDPATGRIAAPTTAAEYVPPGSARGVVRQLTARSHRTAGPAEERLRITDVQAPPQTSAMARLSAADRQLAHLTVTDTVPAADMRSGTTAVGVDWSPSTLGAAAIVAEDPAGLSSNYRGWTYDDRGLGIKLARLQTEGQLLHRKAARLTQLAATAPPRGPSTTRREDRRPRRAPNRCRRQTGKDQPGTGVSLRPPGHRLRRRGGGDGDRGGRPHHPRNPRARAREQQSGSAISPPQSRRRSHPHRRRCRCDGGVRARTRILGVVSGLRRTAHAAGWLPPGLVCAVHSRRKS